MRALEPGFISAADYLEGEKDAPLKHEYVHGEIFAMAGASDVHNTITGNILTVFNIAARRTECRAYASDMKVRVGEAFYYPDVMFVRQDGPDAYYKDKPCVIVEVMSASTVRTDLYEKRLAYRELESLELYLLVDSRRQSVTGEYRTKRGWEERRLEAAIPIPCADVSLSIEDIYLQTPFL